MLEQNANASLSYSLYPSQGRRCREEIFSEAYLVNAEGATLRPPGRHPAWLAAAVQWRNWPLLIKLSMVLVVPVIAALVLGVLRVRADVELANSYSDVERLAAVRGELVSVLSVLQHERALAVQQLSSPSPVYQRWAQGTDRTVAGMTALVRQVPDLGPLPSARYQDLTVALGTLPSARQGVAERAHPAVALAAYSSVINSVLDFDRTLVSRFPQEQLTGLSAALYDLQMAGEQVSFQQAIGLVGLYRGHLTSIEHNLLVEASARLDDKIGDTRTVAPADLWRRYEATVTGPEVDTRLTLVQGARDNGTIALPFSAQQWNATSEETADRMADLSRAAAAQLRSEAAELQDSVSNRAGAQAVLLLVMVLLAGGIGGVIGRYLVRSVRVLHRTALDVALNRLPAAVASIRAGEGAKVVIEPVPLQTTEEFGQLARAFDAVNGQAVRSAAEEASLRSNLRNIFVNLSRRSQGLVERQLRLMEQLEQRADDPEALANLFKLDHLATRMRRNNENLMVLSGMDLGRRATEPMALPDVLRAAVSEVEHYQRAIVRSAPMARIIGYAAGDLVRSVAELVENATAFSPPTTQVIITSRLTEDGSVLIDIVDQGIGMGDAELLEASERVAAGGGVDVPVSRQMGLFVVGSLTARHGIRVRLAKRDDGEPGLMASLYVPADLVHRDGEPVPEADAPTLTNIEPVPAVPQPEPEAVPRHEFGAVPRPEPALVSSGGNGVTGRLESAGIFVRLPDVPDATSPASILFAPRTPVEDGAYGGDFTWLRSAGPKGQPGAAPVTLPPPAAMPTQQGPGGLPKRVPQAQLLSTQQQRGRPATGPRDAARARGFLSSFQAGLRRTEESNEEGST
jgi:signal transduction histidine kinase